jgi:hypothetical protein
VTLPGSGAALACGEFPRFAAIVAPTTVCLTKPRREELFGLSGFMVGRSNRQIHGIVNPERRHTATRDVSSLILFLWSECH